MSNPLFYQISYNKSSFRRIDGVWVEHCVLALGIGGTCLWDVEGDDCRRRFVSCPD